MYIIDPEKEKKEILNRYRYLLSAWKAKSEKDRRLVRKAFTFAVEAHKDMRRKSGEPYIYHPIEVARICIEEIGLGTTSILAALMHDVVEDTEYTLADIEGMFGPVVARIIDGLTKVRTFVHAQDTDSGSLQAETFRKILQIFLSEDIRVILIKLADRLHNMRTLEFLNRGTQLKISSETHIFFAPLANRLGLYLVKTELEDLVLKFTEPEAYATIDQKLKDSELERARFINSFILPLKRSMAEQGFQFRITGRIKSHHSIWEKLQKKDVSLEEVYDLFAVRIIIDTPREKEKLDCWRVYSIISDFYKPNRERLRDWISNPKANGYESLHTTVMSHEGRWVEVQIRSKRMDDIAEKGYAAHWKYKQQGDSESGIDEWLRQAKEIIEGNTESDALELVDEFTRSLFGEEIYVVTPKGDEVKLPAGSTTLDFAFFIHSQIGTKAIGAKVNYKLVPLEYKLNNGDQIEIITSSRQKPKEEWLSIVTTAKARSRIKEALREERKLAIIRGKKKLDEILSTNEIKPGSETLKTIQTALQIKDPNEIYLRLENGSLGSDEILHSLRPPGREGIFNLFLRPFFRLIGSPGDASEEEILSTIHENPGSLLLSEDVKEFKTVVAVCCQPVPGDDVIGLRINPEEIEIHRTICPHALQFMSKHGDKIVKSKWKPQEDVSFLCGLMVRTGERKGMIKDLLDVISVQFNLNIRSLHIETAGQISRGIFMVYVQHTKTISDLIEGLKKVPGVMIVKRINKLEEKNPMASE
ncbi:MAG: RelA/SpoT family protein [Bacteroidota bacterium]